MATHTNLFFPEETSIQENYEVNQPYRLEKEQTEQEPVTKTILHNGEKRV